MSSAQEIKMILSLLGFSREAGEFLATTQGYDTLEEFGLLTDDEVENLCKVVRRPGGVMKNPDGDKPENVPNPGISVSLRAENNLKLACYYVRWHERTSRAIKPTDVTLTNIRKLRDLKKWEEDHKDAEPPTINSRDWSKTIEAIEEYLFGCLGSTKIPLKYVIREEMSVPPAATDPSVAYPSLQDELVRRAPIKDGSGFATPTYLSDRQKVWELLSELLRDKECWSYVRTAQKDRDGRKAFLSLKGHYLGENNIDNMSTRAERKLQNTAYTGEKRRWNFERYVRVHVDQHNILEGLTKHGYAGIDERSKVRHLVAGIKTKDLDSVKTRIMSDAALRQNFDACVNLFQDFIEQKGLSNVRESHVAAMITGKDEEGNGNPDFSIEDRYYTRDEYKKLTAAQRLGLRLKRKKRGAPKGKGGQGGKRRKLDISPKSVKAIVSALKSCDLDDDEKSATKDETKDESSDSSEDEAPKKRMKGNRNNKALSRKGKE